MQKIFLIISFVFLSLIAFGQQDLYSWKIKGFAGVAHYYSSDINSSEYSKVDENYLYRLEIVKGLSNTFGFSASSTFGNIKGIDSFDRVYSSDSRMASLRLYLYTDNGWLLNSSSFISPYFYGGFGLSITETRYAGFNNKSKSNPVIPFGAGLKFRISERFNIDVQAEGVYNPDEPLKTLAIQKNNSNNIYFDAGISIAYSFGFRRSTYKAPKFYVDNVNFLKKVDSAATPRQNLVEAMLKMKPRNVDKLKMEERDSILLRRPDSMYVVSPDSLKTFEKMSAKDSIVILEKKIINDSTMTGKDSLVSDTARYEIRKVMVDSIGNVTEEVYYGDSTLVLSDTSAIGLSGDSVEVSVKKFKTNSGKDSVLIEKNIFKTQVDSSRIGQGRFVKVIDTTSVRPTPDTVKIAPVDTVIIKSSVEPRQKIARASDDVAAQERRDREQTERLDRLESQMNRQPKNTVVEKKVYVPMDISGGYIVGLKPDQDPGTKDTLGWEDVKAYFDSLTELNNAYLYTIDSLRDQMNVVSDEEDLTRVNSKDEFVDQDPVMAGYMNKQEQYNKSMQERFDRLEKEMLKSQQENKALSLASKNQEAIKSLNDSIGNLNKLLSEMPTKDVVTEKAPLNTTVYFKSGSSTIPTESFVELKRIAQSIVKDPTLKILLTGYTDMSGDPKFNLALSKKRALAVSQYFQKYGVSEERITLKYFGETKAVKRSNPLIRKVEVQTFK